MSHLQVTRTKYTEKNYIDKCKELNLDFIGTHKDSKRGTIIEFICPKHRNKGVQNSDWSHFRLAKKGCSYCSGKHITTEDVVASIKHKNVELLSEYIGCEKPIRCRCKTCGNIWETVPKVLTTNGSGCPKCGKKVAADKRRKSQQEFENELKAVQPNITVLGKYISVHSQILCECNIHKTKWYGYPANLLNKSAGCPSCNTSRSEGLMLEALERMHINYLTQYTIPGCKYQNSLKFDAFDIENNVAFEFNGEQHYYPIDFAGKGEEWAKHQLTLTQNRDKAKLAYCKENNIPIVVIPYWERNNMEAYIAEKLERIKGERQN